MEKHLKITVMGRVQGVFYRASAKDKALELTLKGFVKNQPNGDVYMEVEGEEEALLKFVEWCKKGPSRAHVEDIDLKEGSSEGFKNFEVRR